MRQSDPSPRTQLARITGIGSELQGVGRLEDGRAVFVPGALPGEAVEIEVTRASKRFCEARLLRVIEASPDRSESACPYAARCGGCAARHMRYEAALKLKRQRVLDAFTRIGGLSEPTVLETLGCASPERCRNKAEYAVEQRDGRILVGCLEARSHRVLPVEDCLLQKPQSVHALNWLAAHLAEYSCAPHIRYLVTRVNRAGELSVVLSGDVPCGTMQAISTRIDRRSGGTLARNKMARSAAIQSAASNAASSFGTALRALVEAMSAALPEMISLHYCQLRSHPAHALDGVCTRLLGSDAMTDTLLGLRFELSPQSFLQVNPEQAEALYRKALEAVGIGDASCVIAQESATAAAQRNRGESLRILDAYCGAGTITLAAAARGVKCVGVEIVVPAIENARRNAERNGLSERTRFLCGDAAREIPRLVAQGERFDAAILDPPRRGADAAVLNALADANIPRIAYVSCDPATLARDVKLLTERGYALHWAQPVDMFPWTGHVETVALMSRIYKQESTDNLASS